LEYEDRKFYVPTLATHSYAKVTPREDIDRLCNVLLKDDKYIQQIASYLYHRTDELKSYDIKTPAFMDICWYSLPAHQKKFFTLAVSETDFSSVTYYGRRGARQPKISYDSLVEVVRKFEEARQIESLGKFIRTSEEDWNFISAVTGRKDLIPEKSTYTSEEFG
jgi:hypothetical protein